MGGGIAMNFVNAGIPVTIVETCVHRNGRSESAHWVRSPNTSTRAAVSASE